VPKIIENVREQLLAEAKKQILERGYADTTIRSVASACGLGIGTVYNYFKSKEMLIATFIYEDWKKYLCDMENLPRNDPRVLIKGIYDALRNFADENEKLFSDADAAKLVSVGSSSRHKMLRGQISAFLLPVCDSTFTAEFIAEALISWSMEKLDFEKMYPLLEKIIKNNISKGEIENEQL
jgi:AcrR family transcriptional regulator